MIKKVAVFILAVLVLLPVFGQSGRVYAADAETVSVTMANSRSRSSNYGKLVDDTTYFQIRAFSDENGAIDVSWDQNSWTAYVVCNGLNVEATVGKPYIIANGRVIYSGRDNFIENHFKIFATFWKIRIVFLSANFFVSFPFRSAKSRV